MDCEGCNGEVCCAEEIADKNANKTAKRACAKETVVKALKSNVAHYIKNALILAFSLIIFISSFMSTIEINYLGMRVKQSGVQVMDAFFSPDGYSEKELAQVIATLEIEVGQLSDLESIAYIQQYIDKASKIMSKVNIFKLGLTNDEVLNKFSMSSIGDVLINSEKGALRFQLSVYAILILCKLIVSIGLVIYLLVSFILKKKLPLISLAFYILCGLSLMLAITIMPGAAMKLGVAVKLPLWLCGIGIVLLVANGILTAGEKFKLKRIIFKGSAVAVSLIALLVFGFGAANKVNLKYKISGVDVSYKIDLTQFMYSGAYGIEHAEPDIAEAVFNGYRQALGSPQLLTFLTGESIFAVHGDELYNSNYGYMNILSRILPIVFLVAMALLMFQLFSSLYALSENRYRKQELFSIIFAIPLIVYSLVTSILTVITMNYVFDDLKSDAASFNYFDVQLSVGASTVIVLSILCLFLVAAFYYNRFMHESGKHHLKVNAEEHVNICASSVDVEEKANLKQATAAIESVNFEKSENAQTTDTTVIPEEETVIARKE